VQESLNGGSGGVRTNHENGNESGDRDRDRDGAGGESSNNAPAVVGHLETEVKRVGVDIDRVRADVEELAADMIDVMGNVDGGKMVLKELTESNLKTREMLEMVSFAFAPRSKTGALWFYLFILVDDV
jgi:hypothetical protein